MKTKGAIRCYCSRRRMKGLESYREKYEGAYPTCTGGEGGGKSLPGDAANLIYLDPEREGEGEKRCAKIHARR